MRFLLDTHTFIWWDDDPTKLSPRVLALCQDKSNQMVLSVVSAWEIQVKAQLGKLPVLPASLNTIVSRQQSDNGLEILPVRLSHVFALDGLPFHHKDPFDRMLVAQAISENLPFVTHDAIMNQYPVTVIW